MFKSRNSIVYYTWAWSEVVSKSWKRLPELFPSLLQWQKHLRHGHQKGQIFLLFHKVEKQWPQNSELQKVFSSKITRGGWMGEFTTCTLHHYREKKSLRHAAMVAKFLDDNKPIKSLKSLFALFQTSPILLRCLTAQAHFVEKKYVLEGGVW